MPTKEPTSRVEHPLHRRRVADLCGRVARTLSIEGAVEIALILAAEVHRDKPSEADPAGAAGEAQVPSFEGLIVRMAETILHPRQPTYHGKFTGDVELAAQILEACDEFDEAIEFAAYNGTSTIAAIDDYFSDSEARLDPGVAAALRKITRPEVALTLTGKLPVLPAAAARLMRTSAEDVSVFELESIAGSDPVLAGRLLSAANSAFFGFSSSISDLKQAVMRLGIPLARKALMDAAFGPLFASSTLAELWRHSKLVAATAHEMAGECGFDQDVAYVAGLLHDIGRLIIHRCPSGMALDELDRVSSGFPRVYAETLVYGTDHATIGGELLKRWGLPADLVVAVARHHSPEGSESALAAILYLAEDEVAIDAPTSENLSRDMRRAIAVEMAGIKDFPGNRIDRRSPIFALAG